MDTTEHDRPKGREELIFRQLDDEWVVYDPAANKMHVLNLTASLVWAHCGGDLTIAEIAGVVRDTLKQTPPDLDHHVTAAVERFRTEGLLE